ncbi:MAG: hypothetical protein LBJ00_04930 [Planctomycetaceae bacterium]|jgi:hypothetical protein|nr:hypothetical protein [Planctomycetaceae bacterium]
MSGPKSGTVVVGGGAIIGLGAVAAVALPAVAVGLMGYGVYKGSTAAARGVNKAMEEHQKHKGDMLAEINRQERPVQSLLSNAESRWQNEKQSLNVARQKAERELAQLRNTSGTPQAKREAEETFRKAEELFAEADDLNNKFNTANSELKGKFAEARRKTASSARTVRGIISNGQVIADRAVCTINAAIESARNAKLVYEETLLVIQQKAAEERRQEILRQNARSSIDNAKNEMEADTLTFIQDWLGEESTVMINKHLTEAEKAFKTLQYETSTKLAQESVAMYRKFYDTALQTKQKFEQREIIADAITAALTDLQYDEPDVNYEPKDGEENTMLGNITIFAKSKGETGDMRLAIDMDGKVNLEVENIPEGQESECHQKLTDLQTKVSSTVDLEITDWGRASHVKPANKDGVRVQQKIQQQEKIRQRGV